MTLSALTWRQLPVQNLAAGASVASIIDAIYSALTSTTYINGAARTPGSGVAWTFTRYQNAGVTEAIYGNPPAAINTLNQKVIIAGREAAPTPTLTYNPNGSIFYSSYVYYGLAKNAGAFTSWTTSPTPFTTGQFSGYGFCLFKQSAVAIQIRTFECQDGILCIANSTTSSGCQYFFVGGLVDPETGDTVSDAESDGKLYVMANGTSNSAAIGTSIGSQGFSAGTANAVGFSHCYKESITNSGQNKAYCFLPGSSSMLPLSRIGRYSSVGLSLNSRSGKYVKLPLLLSMGDANLNYTDPPLTFAGRLREIWMTRNAVCGTTLRNAGTDLGYFISDSILSAGGAFLLSC